MAAAQHDTTCDYLVFHTKPCSCGADPEPAELTADGPDSPKPPPPEAASAQTNSGDPEVDK
jgi:hypothetical protein